jgi:hypothetical protein
MKLPFLNPKTSEAGPDFPDQAGSASKNEISIPD